MAVSFPARSGVGLAGLLPHASRDAVALIAAMCCYDPDARVSAKQALRHAYFRDLR